MAAAPAGALMTIWLFMHLVLPDNPSRTAVDANFLAMWMVLFSFIPVCVIVPAVIAITYASVTEPSKRSRAMFIAVTTTGALSVVVFRGGWRMILVFLAGAVVAGIAAAACFAEPRDTTATTSV